jgi:2-methylaconitate cis-trans-isomerase PrpF
VGQDPSDPPLLEYTFLQVGVEDGLTDMSGNCGNLTSAVGPYAIDDGLLERQLSDQSILDFNRAIRIRTEAGNDSLTVPATIDLLNRNTNKTIRSTFFVSATTKRVQNRQWEYEPRGDFEMPGVPGTGSEIRLQWLQPGGSKTPSALPTGSAIDEVIVNGHPYSVSLVDVSNPGIFIDGRELGWDPSRKPTELDNNTSLMATLEGIRRAGTEMMGLDPTKPSVPKIVIVFAAECTDRHIDCQVSNARLSEKDLRD